MALSDDLSNAISSAWNQVTTTGIPAVIAAGEAYGATQLQGMAQANVASATAAAKAIMSSPGATTGSFAATLNGVFSQIAGNAVIKQYGLPLAIGAIILFIVIRKI